MLSDPEIRLIRHLQDFCEEPEAFKAIVAYVIESHEEAASSGPEPPEAEQATSPTYVFGRVRIKDDGRFGTVRSITVRPNGHTACNVELDDGHQHDFYADRLEPVLPGYPGYKSNDTEMLDWLDDARTELIPQVNGDWCVFRSGKAAPGKTIRDAIRAAMAKGA